MIGVRRRVLAGLMVLTAGATAYSAQASTTHRPGEAPASLVRDLAAICAHAARGTYGLPGHYCDSPASLYQEITGESADRIAAEAQRAAIQSAPSGNTPAQALARAIDQRNRLAARGSAAVDSHGWTRNGIGPLQAADPGYTGVNGLGLVELSGRVTDFTYDSKHRTVYASVATGGLFASSDFGAHWTSVGENLPTQLIGSVGYTPANGGTLVVVTGDGSFGRYSLEGAGVYSSTNGGRSWRRATGAPSDAFGFRVAVDPSNPKVVYAATGAGLFRSDDAARSFRNVALPTGPCAGKSNRTKGCLLANVVTDVVVEAPGGFTNVKGGRVLAAVGWRNGQSKNPDGSVQSPNNGLYSSPTGKPGTFTRSAALGFTQQDHIGRIGLGATTGPAQNHDYVYALVQNAKQTQKDGNPSIPVDAAGPVNSQLNGTAKAVGTLDGVFVSPDFGATWVKMADGTELASPTTGSALAVTGPALAGYGAGVQAWYNQFIKPDPTRAVAGVPTRLLFGLEEVWQNENTSVPQNGPSSFRVVGRYFSGSTCLFLDLLPACPTNREEALDQTTTTHPDQHAVLFVPDGEGGVRVLVGNDGGAYTQHVGPSQEFTNAQWGKGSNNGLTTLSPYNVARAKDGTIWMGLQDNGTAKITDVRNSRGAVTARQRQIETLGGDGFFVGVDPNNPKIAYGEYVGGAMSGTVDGGMSWNAMTPPITHGQFSTPFAVDPLDPQHVIVAGREVVETGSGPGTGSSDWAKLFDLGTANHPGDAGAQETADDSANSQTAIDLYGANAYAAYCGVCDVLEDKRPFRSGIATNVGGSRSPKRYSSAGWHIAAAKGLPERYITSIAMDRTNPKVVYVTLGSYSRRWTPPGTLDKASYDGGHLYKSVDAGEHFTDISADLPDSPANWVSVRGSQLLVATDIGVFASRPSARCAAPGVRGCAGFEVLGKGLPAAPVTSMQVAPWDPNLLTVASFGRGAYTYRFGPAPAASRPVPAPPAPRFLNRKIALYGFENDAEGWTTTTTDAVAAWRRAAPGHSSGESFQVIPYTNDASVALRSPALKLPARSTVQVSWWKTQDTEPCCDGLTLDWSSDGYVWHTVSTKTDQNKDYPNFSPDSVRFVAPAGTLLLRFRVTSDSLVSSPPYTGVRLDDIEIRR
ncbi:MAG: hypothetical protein WCD35_00330 [Mycobacteriales bacterium]